MIAIEGIPPSMYSGMETLNIASSATTLPNNRRGIQDTGQSSRQEAHHHQNNISSQQDRSIAGTSSGVAGGWSQKLKHRKEYTVLKKVVRVLQDNRMINADQDATQRLHNDDHNGAGGAATDADSYPILKTILNVIFITTGVVLLVAVFVVIIYTSIVKPNPSELEMMGQNYFNPADEEPSNRDETIVGEDKNDDHYLDHQQHLLASTSHLSSSSSSESGVKTKTLKECKTIPVVEGLDLTIKFRKLCFNVSLQAPGKTSSMPTILLPRAEEVTDRKALRRRRHFHVSVRRTFQRHNSS